MTIIDTEPGGLADQVEGRVLRPGEDGFADAARPWNVAVEHHPDLLLVPRSPQDVVAGVRWAAERGLPVAVQSTGHGATEAVADTYDAEFLARWLLAFLDATGLDQPFVIGNSLGAAHDPSVRDDSDTSPRFAQGGK